MMAGPTEAIEVINWTKAAALIGAGLCMGVGSLGPSLGQGFIGGKACEAMGRKPESAGVIFKALITAIAVTESSAIYAFVIAIVLIFFT